MTSRDGAVNTIDSNNTNVSQSNSLHIITTMFKVIDFDKVIQIL